MVQLPDLWFGASIKIVKDEDSVKLIQTQAISILREQVAQKLVERKVKVEDHPFLTEYRLEFYILTPDELAALINEKAERLSFERERSLQRRGGP